MRREHFMRKVSTCDATFMRKVSTYDAVLLGAGRCVEGVVSIGFASFPRKNWSLGALGWAQNSGSAGKWVLENFFRDFFSDMLGFWDFLSMTFMLVVSTCRWSRSSSTRCSP